MVLRFPALALLGGLLTAAESTAPKHIVFMMIDDLGWNDVGYRSTSDLKSANIDALALGGVRLNKYYTHNLCSPSRTSFLSGRYAYNIGMQGVVILNGQPIDLPKNVSTVADRLRSGGFRTAAFGKWDAGMTTWDFTPTCRGFDYFFGFYGPAQDHYTHSSGSSLDLRENFEAQPNESGVYSTHLYTQKAQAWITDVVGKQGAEKTFMYLAYQAMHAPVEAPDSYVKQCQVLGVTSENKRDVYCAMMLALDEGVKNVTDAYKALDIWNDTVLVFATDNGGHVGSSGNNWPLRGEKSSNYEGGIRGTAFLHWPGLPAELQGSESEQLVHVSDWLPSFVQGVAGLKLDDDGHPYPVDGVDQWKALTVPGATSARKDVLHEIGGDNGVHQEAYFDGQYKIIRYHPCIYSWNKYTCTKNNCPLGWNPLPEAGDPTPPPAAENLVNGSKSFETGGTWLFDLVADPLEKTELSAKHPEVVERLTKALEDVKRRNIDQLLCPIDPDSNPANFGHVWTPWRGSRQPMCGAGGHTAPDSQHCIPESPMSSLGALKVQSDKQTCSVNGWCSGPKHAGPSLPVQVTLDGVVVAQDTASVHREIAGDHGFELQFPCASIQAGDHSVNVQCQASDTGTWFSLKNGPKCVRDGSVVACSSAEAALMV